MKFISVREVLDSIANQLTVPQDYVDRLPISDTPTSDPAEIWPYSDQKKAPPIVRWFHNVKVRMLNDLFISAFQRSNAAAVLDQHLHNSTQRPKWYDCNETGRPKVSETAHAEVQPMLVHMAHYFDRYMKAFRAGRFEHWPRGSNIQGSEGKFGKPADDQRMELIGFDHSELVEFLDRHAISHSLGTASHLILPRAAEASEVNRLTPPSQSPVDFASRIHRAEKPGDHKLRRCIDQARNEAKDRWDVDEVWRILAEMAEGVRRRRPPEMERHVLGRGIEFRRGVNTVYFTHKHLGKQFAYERKKLAPLPPKTT